MVEKRVAILGLVIAAFIWAISSVSLPIFLELGFSVILIIWIRRIFNFITVWVISDVKKVKHEWVKDRHELKILLINGLFSIATPILFVLALERTSLSNTYFLVYAAPAWVLIGAVFFLGEKINLKKILGLGLTLVGIGFIARPESLLALDPGIIFALLCSISFAAYIITSRELKDYALHTVAIYSSGIGLVVVTFLVTFIFGIPEFAFNPIYLGILAGIGMLRGVATDLYFFALEKLEAGASLVQIYTGFIYEGPRLVRRINKALL